MYIVQVQSPNQCWTGFKKVRDKYPSVINTSYINTYSSIFKTFKELLLGILTSLVLRKYEFFRVFEIMGTGVSFDALKNSHPAPTQNCFFKVKGPAKKLGFFHETKVSLRVF